MNYDPELAAALATNPFLNRPTPLLPPGVSEAASYRKMLSATHKPFAEYYAQRLPDSSQYTVFDRQVSVEDGKIMVRCVIPTCGDGETVPVLVWMHGGGWVFGDLDQDDMHLRTISVELKVAIVNVDYRLAPEHPFPIPFEDSYTAVKWVVEHAPELKVDLKKGFVVAGDSAGGNMAAAIALQARDDTFFNAHSLTGQYLRQATVCSPEAHPEKYRAELRSLSEYTNTPVLKTETVHNFISLYAPPSAANDLRISPLLAASHAGLPPAFIQVQELDPLHDEEILYEKLLREAGVPTKLIEYSGCFHAFHYLFPGVAAAVKLDRDAREGIKWLLFLSNAS
ncbi:hypothetical protein L226DRAFT_548399 [Lentinus tigrinus ALCF2SS1-7]|uniref:Alpha/beta hydrolase fold-3 domain-containing protein n=1 Tax=Lentinus tigrinus ALCF2SS1-6 TaxID=1328759 RepID=A0A5C2RRV1_9APHY|nr:hypothetical protein L227DRAFT_378176 [Lentinus tigrinus ALCF2SS1-6]RPD68834.1 hypothetical protein L226DRAFT_548399 [Lentinus tigrinus ALCF2SS1-7]